MHIIFLHSLLCLFHQKLTKANVQTVKAQQAHGVEITLLQRYYNTKVLWQL